MATPGRPERNRAARSFRQLRRFHHVINSDEIFGTHRFSGRSKKANARRFPGSEMPRRPASNGTNLRFAFPAPRWRGYLDGKLYLEHTLSEAVSGRVGLWSKSDGYMHFADYTVTSAN